MSKMTSHAPRAILATLLLGLCLQADAGTPAPAGSDHADARLRTVLAYELADIRSRDQWRIMTRRRRAEMSGNTANSVTMPETASTRSSASRKSRRGIAAIAGRQAGRPVRRRFSSPARS